MASVERARDTTKEIIVTCHIREAIDGKTRRLTLRKRYVGGWDSRDLRTKYS